MGSDNEESKENTSLQLFPLSFSYAACLAAGDIRKQVYWGLNGTPTVMLFFDLLVTSLQEIINILKAKTDMSGQL